MPAPNQNFLINYGGFLAGGTGAGAGRKIRGYLTYQTSFTESGMTFLLTTGAGTTSAADAEFTAVENAFRKPRQDLVFTDAGNTVLSLKQSDSTGLDCFPEIYKEGHPSDTALSRTYRVRLSFGRPADNISTSGRRSSSVNVTLDPSAIQTVIINGVYTAITSTDSYTQYLAQIATFVSGELTFINSGGTFEIIGAPQQEYNSSRKVMSFSRVYRQIIHNQSSGTLDDPALVNPTMTISRERYGPGDTVDISGFWGLSGDSFSIRPTIMNVTYSSAVDQTVSTDLTSAQWANKLRPFILSEINTVLGGGVVALLEEKPEFDPYQNRINIGMRVLAVVGGNVLEQKCTLKHRYMPNWILPPLWKASRFARFKYPGPSSRIRTLIEDRRVVGTYSPEDIGWRRDLSDNWILVFSEPACTPLRLGILGNTIDVTDIHVETVWEYAEVDQGGGGGGPPNTPTTTDRPPVATQGGSALAPGSMSVVTR